MKDHIDRNAAIIGWLSGIGIPLSILLAGWLVSSTVESSKIDYEYVKIAISILASDNSQSDSKNIQDDEVAMRKWAIRLLNEKSPEKLTKAEQEALMRSPQIIKLAPTLLPELQQDDRVSIAEFTDTGNTYKLVENRLTSTVPESGLSPPIPSKKPSPEK
ncbi:MAG: hypothetical protein ABL859_06665 [Methylotenera sp.]